MEWIIFLRFSRNYFVMEGRRPEAHFCWSVAPLPPPGCIIYLYLCILSLGHQMSAKIAEWAPSVHVHFNRGAKRQFWELCLETYIKMSGHSARSCLHLAESGQNKIDVTPHDWSVYSPSVQTGIEWEKNDETAFNGLYLDTKDSINGVHFYICLKTSSNSPTISISL